MGLYINKDEHPDVYENNKHLAEPNQVEFRIDYLSQVLEKQSLASQLLQNSISHIQNAQTQWNYQQLQKWGNVELKLGELKNLHGLQSNLEHQAIELLERIEKQNKDMQQKVEHDHLTHQTILHDVNSIGFAQKEIVKRIDLLEGEHKELLSLAKDFGIISEAIMKRLDEFGLTNDLVQERLEQQSTINEQMLTHLSFLENSQKEVVNIVDNHEGLMEKIIRQIDHLRSIVFERSSIIEEKIEKLLHLTVLKSKNNS